MATFGLSGEKLKTARQTLVAGPLKLYLQWLEDKLEGENKQYFIENRLTLADLKVFVWSRALSSGQLEHIPVNLVADIAPKVFRHQQFINQLAPIVQYYAKRNNSLHLS